MRRPFLGSWKRVVTTAALAAVALAAWGSASPAAGQFLPTQPANYTLVSEIRGVESLWANPAALAFDPDSELMGILAFGPDEGENDAGLRQALLGARAGLLAIGVRRDRFRTAPGQDRLDGTALTISVGVGTDRFSFGLANDQYRRGVTASRWELGGMWRATDRLDVGASWRDIGSPMVIGERAPSRVLGGATLRLPLEGSAVSIEGMLEEGSLERIRSLVRVRLPVGVDAFGAVALDGDQEFARFDLGLSYRFESIRGFGVLGQNRARAGDPAGEHAVGGAWRF
jgi:hypothetical protein